MCYRVLKGRRRRAVDSTILADAVATQDTVTQLVSAIRRVAREVPGAAEQIAAVCTGHAHVAADPQTGIITGEKLTGAAGQDNSDPAVAAEFLAAEAAGAGRGAGEAAVSSQDTGDDRDGDRLLAWYGDSAYGTGDLRAAIGTAGHQAVIKPKPVQPAVEGGFTTDDFTVNAAAGTVTCPAGLTRHLTARNAVIFGGRLPGVPAAREVHDRQRRPHLAPARARRPAARRPRGLGRRPGTAPGLHDTPD